MLKEDQWTISGSAVTPESLKIRSPMEPGGCGWGEVWGWHTRSFFEVVLVVANVYYIYIITIIYYMCTNLTDSKIFFVRVYKFEPIWATGKFFFKQGEWTIEKFFVAGTANQEVNLARVFPATKVGMVVT
jgi:hypothetical protein